MGAEAEGKGAASWRKVGTQPQRPQPKCKSRLPDASETPSLRFLTHGRDLHGPCPVDLQSEDGWLQRSSWSKEWHLLDQRGEGMSVLSRDLMLSCLRAAAAAATAAAQSFQSCPTLGDPVDGSPTGSPVPGILQARTLEWVAISFSNA